LNLHQKVEALHIYHRLATTVCCKVAAHCSPQSSHVKNK